MPTEPNTSQNPPLPDCLVIGPQKAGTTWIHRYFLSRSDIALAQGVKETFFFDRRYQRGLKWYARHFRGQEDKPRVAEVGPTYFHCPEAPRRVLDDLGPIRPVCTLRHPARRAFSLYLHMRRFGRTRLSFREAVAQHSEILASSLYATNLKRWYDAFGKENILVLFLESLADDPNTYAETLCRHLDLPFDGVDPSLNRRVNEAALSRNSYLAQAVKAMADAARSVGLYGLVTAAKNLGLKEKIFGQPGDIELPKLSQEDRIWFTRQIADEIDEIERLLETDLPHWKAGI